MKNITLIIITAIVFFSCDRRESSIYEDFSVPVLKIGQYENQTADKSYIQDTIKKGRSYFFKYSIDKDYIIDYTVEGGKAEINLLSGICEIYPDTVYNGIIKLILSVEDELQNKTTAECEIVVLENQPPVVIEKITKLDNLSPYEIQVDLSESYDQDERFGGEVKEYWYSFSANYILEDQKREVIRYIYGSPGQKKITVKCKDNDGAWSEEKVIYIDF
jgi:hypothetical protein